MTAIPPISATKGPGSNTLLFGSGLFLLNFVKKDQLNARCAHTFIFTCNDSAKQRVLPSRAKKITSKAEKPCLRTVDK